MRQIDGDKLIATLNKVRRASDRWSREAERQRIKELERAEWINRVFDDAVNKIIKTPIIAPLKHGRWIEYPDVLQFPDVLDESYIGCSQCKNVFSVIDNCTERFNYCPNCGAKMDKEEK